MAAKATCPERAWNIAGVQGRTLYVVDIENMVGSGALTRSAVAQMQRRIEGAVPPREGDHTVIASSHFGGEGLVFGWWGSAHRKLQSGPDGADDALLDELADVEWVANRYKHVVIASGDHAFAFAFRALQVAGVRVTLIPPDVGCSQAMRKLAGDNIVQLGFVHPANVTALFRPLGKESA